MKASIANFRVEGLCAAPFTPFDETTHDLALAVVRQQAKLLADTGVRAAFVGGTTGESLSLTLSERKQLTEEWVKVGKEHGITVIVHTGCESLRETQDLGRHAQAVGAAAVGLMPPTFIKPGNLNALVEIIAEAAAASPALPVYYYHIACMTGVDFNMESLLTAIDAKGIPNFRGIKFTDYKISEYMGCIRNFEGRYDMLYGRDEQLLMSLVAGAKGAVGSTYNYMGEIYVELMKHYNAGNIEKAQECQHRALKVIALLGQGARYGSGSVDVGKAVLELRGVPVGPPRLPRAPMSAEGKALLRSDLKKLNFNLADEEPAAKKAKTS